jgi:hypothetical protein
VLEYEGGQFVDTKKKNLDAFVEHIGRHGSGRFDATMRRVRNHLDMLADVFHDRDSLLGAQGHIPLYYMFISRLNAADRRRVREFLERFERDRRTNRNDRRHDRSLDDYDLASRSTNDRRSFETRIRVIRAKFAAWKRAQDRRR